MNEAPAPLAATEAWLRPPPEGLPCGWEVVRERGTAGTKGLHLTRYYWLRTLRCSDS